MMHDGQWYPEVRHFCPKAPILLVGTKADLRDSETYVAEMKAKRNETPVSKEQVYMIMLF